MGRFRPTPTTLERRLHHDDFIVSKTDPASKILYGNRTFIDLSGYPEKELIGCQHSIIRHPDMPRDVFTSALDYNPDGQGSICLR